MLSLYLMLIQCAEVVYSKKERTRKMRSAAGGFDLKQQKLMVMEVTRMEDDKLLIKSVSQCQQGRWTAEKASSQGQWDGVTCGTTLWQD